MATTRPDQDFPVIVLPIPAGTVEVYSQKNGTPGRISLEDLKEAIDQSISIDGSDLTITKQAGDQTVSLPSSPIQTLANGLTLNVDEGELGGPLTKATEITNNGFQLLVNGSSNFRATQVNGSDSADLKVEATTGITIDAADGTDNITCVIAAASGKIEDDGGNKLEVTPLAVIINTPTMRDGTAQDGSILRLQSVANGQVEYTDYSLPAAISGQQGSVLITEDLAAKTVNFTPYKLPVDASAAVDGSLMHVFDQSAGDIRFTGYAFPLTISGDQDQGVLQIDAGANSVGVTPYGLPEAAPAGTGDYVFSYNSVSGLLSFKERNSGTFSGTTDVDGRVSVNHGLESAAGWAIATPAGPAAIIISFESSSSSTIAFKIYDVDGNDLANTAVEFHWMAQV